MTVRVVWVDAVELEWWQALADFRESQEQTSCERLITATHALMARTLGTFGEVEIGHDDAMRLAQKVLTRRDISTLDEVTDG
jgi:hypothetical protein